MVESKQRKDQCINSGQTLRFHRRLLHLIVSSPPAATTCSSAYGGIGGFSISTTFTSSAPSSAVWHVAGGEKKANNG
jgi:hypothetical protein